MKKTLSQLSARELLAKQEKARELASSICSELIASGRGHEKPSETRTKTDELSLRWLANSRECADIGAEVERRKTWHGSLKPIRASGC